LKAMWLKGFQQIYLINIVPCIDRVPMGVPEYGTRHLGTNVSKR
ncbi:MAG: hypothetical protein K0S25_643, partial [Bacillus sp. (in: firmicutes)]|nr:hypothetical protein [Bacillus sp. (in: firmicutes)]